MKSLEYKCQQCVCDFSCLMQHIITSLSSSLISSELQQLQNKIYIQYYQKVVKLILYILQLHVKCLLYSAFRLKLTLNQKGWLKQFNQTLFKMKQKFEVSAADSSWRGKKLCLIFFVQHQWIFRLFIEIMKSLFMSVMLWYNQFEYAVIHWLTVNVFCINDWMFKAKKYTPKLASYLYWVWLIIIHYIHRIYKQQICDDKKQMEILHEYHCKYLCNSSLSLINEILFLLTQDRRQVKRQLDHRVIHWFWEKKVLIIRKKRMKIAQTKNMMKVLVKRAERIMWKQLIFTEAVDIFFITTWLRCIHDDHHCQSLHYFFWHNSVNTLNWEYLWIMMSINVNKNIKNQIMSHHWKDNLYWDLIIMKSYQNNMIKFLKIILILIHFSDEQSVHSSEMFFIIMENMSWVWNMYVFDD